MGLRLTFLFVPALLSSCAEPFRCDQTFTCEVERDASAEASSDTGAESGETEPSEPESDGGGSSEDVDSDSIAEADAGHFSDETADSIADETPTDGADSGALGDDLDSAVTNEVETEPRDAGDNTAGDPNMPADEGGTSGEEDAERDAGHADDAEPSVEVDSGPALPAGACTQPANPEDGTYADCSGTLDGGTCQLTCRDPAFIGGLATCVAGEWTVTQCAESGSLTLFVRDAADRSLLVGAEVYIEGFHDPNTPCEESDYCQTSGADGTLAFELFPAGAHRVAIAAEGCERTVHPMNIAPAMDQTTTLTVPPAGYLEDYLLVVLTWETAGNVNLHVNVPGIDGQCVHWREMGSLDAAPLAHLDIDAVGNSATNRGPETLHIELNEERTGPAYDGTYSVMVATPDVDVRSLQTTRPSVRLIRAGENGAVEVELFQLPDTAVENAHTWHVFDLHGDGTFTPGSDTESLTEITESKLMCVAEAI